MTTTPRRAARSACAFAVALALLLVAPAIGHAAPRATSVQSQCVPSSLLLSEELVTSCTISVYDSSSPTADRIPPTGTVSFPSSSRPADPLPDTCTLTPVVGTPVRSSCTVEFRPAGSGVHTVRTVYTPDDPDAFAPPRFGTPSFQVSVQNETSSSVSCTPQAPQRGRIIECSVFVNNLTEGATSGPSFSTVTFSSSGPGIFGTDSTSRPTCTIYTGTPSTTGTCRVFYQKVQGGEETISASYPGTRDYLPTQASTLVNPGEPVPRPTETSLACTPAGAAVGSLTKCTVTVTDVGTGAGDPRVPTGTVPVGAVGGGSFPSGAACNLAPDGDDRARCSFVYQPSSPGTQVITATMRETPQHLSSQGRAVLPVQPGADCTSCGQASGPLVFGGPGTLFVPPAPAAAPAPARPPASTPAARRLTVSKPTSTQARSLARTGKLSVKGTAPAAGRLSARITAKLSKKGKAKTVARTSIRATRAGSYTLSFRLSREARTALRKLRRLTLRVEVTSGSTKRTTSLVVRSATGKASR